MATRNTIQKAQELKENLEITHPTRKFRIVDQSEKMRIGRKAAEAYGYEILEDTGNIMVLVNCTEFAVLEVRKCGCGEEVLTAAIGEDSLDECDECYRRRQERQARVLAHGIEKSAQRAAQGDEFDRNSEG